MMPQFVQYHYNQYHTLLMRYWNQMTPIQYVSILVFIAVVGWLAMKSVGRR